VGNLTDEFEREMYRFRGNPSCRCRDRAQFALHGRKTRDDFFGKINGYKNAHLESSKHLPHDIERGLSRLPAYSIPASREHVTTVFGRLWARNRNVHGSHRLFSRTPGGTGHTGDSHTDGCPHFFSDALRQPASDFFADGALHFQKERRNAGKIDLGLITV